ALVLASVSMDAHSPGVGRQKSPPFYHGPIWNVLAWDMDIHEATAVYVFTPDFERLLFIRHRKPPLAGRWLPPGGHVDPGETPEESAVREVLEETGQSVVLLDLTPHFPREVGPRVTRIHAPLLVQVEDLGDHR